MDSPPWLNEKKSFIDTVKMSDDTSLNESIASPDDLSTPTLLSMAIQCIVDKIARDVSRIHIPNIDVHPIDLIDFDARVDALKLPRLLTKTIKHALPYDKSHDGDRVMCVGCGRLVTMTCCTSVWPDGRCQHRSTSMMIDYDMLKNNNIPSICDSCDASNVEVDVGKCDLTLAECSKYREFNEHYEYSGMRNRFHRGIQSFETFITSSNCGLQIPTVSMKRSRSPIRGRDSRVRVLEPF